jgi:hypothetical protein
METTPSAYFLGVLFLRRHDLNFSSHRKPSFGPQHATTKNFFCLIEIKSRRRNIGIVSSRASLPLFASLNGE